MQSNLYMAATPITQSSPFEKLSLEILDEIFSHLVEPIDVKQYAQGNRVFADHHHFMYDEWDFHLFDFVRKILREDEYRVWRGHLQLRLVSKAFYWAVSRVFWQHECTVLRMFEDNTVPIMRQISMTQERAQVSLVRHMCVEIEDRNSDNRFKFPWKSTSVFSHRHDSGRTKDKLFRDFLQELPKLLSAIPKLESLVLNLREAWCWGADQHPGNPFTLHVDTAMLEELRNCFVTIFSSPTINFENLVYLRLMLPCTYDLVMLGNALGDRLLNRLHHLYLQYIDGTGPYGRKEYTQGIDWTNEREWEYFQYSNLQEKYPNTQYSSDLCTLLSGCRNLQSLGLVCTQPLDCSSLDWQPSGHGLTNLFLKRAFISSSALLKLLSPSPNHHSANIEAVWLEDVVLSSGTWEQIFQFLLNCPSLKYINPDNLAYPIDSQFFEDPVRPWENIANVWTENESDRDILGELVQLLVDRAGGLTYYPREFYETSPIE